MGSYVNQVKIGDTTHLIEPTLYATGAGTASAITAAVNTNFALITGVQVAVKMSVDNAVNATLNISSTGAKNIRYDSSNIAAGVLKSGRVYNFIYDGTYWQVAGELLTKINTQSLIRPSNLNGVGDVTYQALINDVRANRLAFLPADQIIIEKTTDGGSTWVDAGISDATKTALFSETRPGGVSLPKINDEININCGLRITITGMKYNVPENTPETQKYNYWNNTYVKSCERYNQIKLMYFWVNTATNAIKVTVQKATGANPNNWSNVFVNNNYGMTGWSGNDIITFGQGVFGGGTTQTGNTWNWRIILMTCGPNGSDTLTQSYLTSTMQVYEIRGYGDTWWTAGNKYAASDHLYSWDYNKNAVFPANLTAVKFIGPLQGTADKATAANITSTQYGIAYYSNTTGTFAGTGAGTSGQYLKSNGTSAPTWASFPSTWTPSSHTHGNLTNDGKIGSTADYAVYTTTGGAITAGSLETATPSASGNATAFITSVSQNSKGKITATKANLDTSGTWSGNATTATTATETKWLMNRGTNVTVADSSWAHGQKGRDGTNTTNGTVWKQKWTQSGLTYTPSGGSATTLSDSGDIVYWLSQSPTSNNLWVNMAIDGYIYSHSGFKILTQAAAYNEGIRFVNSSATDKGSINCDINGILGLYGSNKVVLRPEINASTKGLEVQSATVIPTANNAMSLGDSSHKWTTVYATTFDGNATTATALATGRTLQVALGSTSASTAFDGSANISNIGVSGTLAIAQGGTGKTTAAEAWTALGGGASGKHADSYFVKATTSTDNAVTRFDGTSGQVQNSGIIIDDDNNIIFPTEKGISFKMNRKNAEGGGWAYSYLRWYDSASSMFANIGIYGNNNNLSHIFIGTNSSYSSDVNLQIYANGTIQGKLFSGSGASLTSLNASNISSGTLAIARIADGSITNAKLENSKITIAGTDVSLGGSISLETMGLSNALHFIGITSTTLTNGSTTSTLTEKSTNSLSKTTGFVDGDVVMDGDQLREYVWSGSAWRLLGITTSSAYTQPATTATNTWIAQISQGTDGKITATTGTLDTSGTWSGNAVTATTASSVSRATFGDRNNGEHNASNIDSNGLWYYSSNGPASTLGAQSTDGALYSQAYSTFWVGQIAQDYRDGQLFVRSKNNNSWQNWYAIPKFTTSTGGVGESTTPVYVDTNGNLVACTAYSNASVNYATSAGSATSATTATSLTDFVISKYTIPVSKGVRIKYKTNSSPVLISSQLTVGGGRLILIGGGYGQEVVRSDFTEVVSCNSSNMTWSVPNTTGYDKVVEIMNLNPSNTASITVWAASACEFEEISALTTTATNRKLLHSSNYTDYTVTKTGTGASGTWGISITGSAGSVAWANTGHPDTFPPIIGTTSTTAMAGNTNVNNVTHTKRTDAANNKYYVTGTTSSATNTGGDIFDTGVYVTTVDGGLSAVRQYWNYSDVDKAYSYFNNTTQSIDFVFI